MNKISFFIIFLYSTVCKSQGVTYNELYYLLTHDLNHSSRYLVDSGFSIKKIGNPADNYPEYSYWFIKNTGLNCISIHKRSYETEVFTYSQNENQYLKKSIETLGFRLDSIKSLSGQSKYVFRKGNLQILFTKMLMPPDECLPNNDNPSKWYNKSDLVYGYDIILSDTEILKKLPYDYFEW